MSGRRAMMRRGSRQRRVEDGYGVAYIADLGFGFRQGNLYETVKKVLLQRYWLTMRGDGGLAQAAWPLMRRCRTSRR
jgi:hypothetical protein